MGRAVKIAISLPEDFLQTVERERDARGQSRSEFFRCAVEEMLSRDQERKWDEEYIRSYREQPETPEELAVTRAFLAVSAESLARESPWDDE